jgi:hypothetical protein
VIEVLCLSIQQGQGGSVFGTAQGHWPGRIAPVLVLEQGKGRNLVAGEFPGKQGEHQYLLTVCRAPVDGTATRQHGIVQVG